MTLDWTVSSLADAVAGGRVSAREACEAHLARVERLNERLNAFTCVARAQALARADALDADRRGHAERPLAGVPIAIKDNICTRGLPTTAGSRLLRRFVPPYTARAVDRLEAAGAIVIGKTNCDEFGMGSSNENSAFGPVRNPWDLERTPGGSSGGSAAAVAARLAPAALGSDTGGSVRQPAAMCGVVGLKPTYGRVSRYGLLAYGSSLDQIGPLARTVEDAARLLKVMAGHDDSDATSAVRPVDDYAAALRGEARGARLGVPWTLLDEGVDSEVLGAFRAAIDAWRAEGVAVDDVDLPSCRHAIPVYYLVATAEASANLARYDGVRYTTRAPGAETLAAMYQRTRDEGFGAEVKRRILLGTYVLSAGYYDAYYLKAQQVRTLIRRDHEQALERCDAIVLPTSPVPAFRLGERVADPLQMYLADVFTVSANLAGLPALSLPAGFTKGGLPIGVQLVGRAFDEASILRLAAAYERLAPWWRQAPPLATDVPPASPVTG
jgi:aspartyl-tRNA(Asn)/glutamyl-tRNA(Gln) amidotransferase subunit A